MNDLIIALQNSDAWKIQLTTTANFIFSKDNEEERVMYSTSDNIKFTSGNDVNEVVNELFKSLLLRYQNNLETWMRVIDFVSDLIKRMHYKCHKVNYKPGGSYIYNKCFKYAATVAIKFKEIKNNPERVSNIKCL